MIQFNPIQKPRQHKVTEVNLNQFIDEIYKRLNDLSNKADVREIVSADPSGSLNRQLGTHVTFISGAVARLFVNVDGATAWDEIT